MLPGRVFTVALAVALAAAVALTGVGLGVDGGYDTRYPRPTSLGYGVDGDTGAAYWVSTGAADDPVTGPLLADRVPLPDGVFPNVAPQSPISASARPAPSVVAPTVDAPVSVDRGGGVREVRVRLRAAASATKLLVYADVAGNEIIGVTANGARLPGDRTAPDGQWGMSYAAPPADGVELVITVRGAGELPLTVLAQYTGLPAEAGAPTLPPDASWVQMSAYAGQSFASRRVRV